MKEIFRSNDLVKLSCAQALLSEAGIESVVLDAHTGTIYGGALIQRRLMVLEEDADAAQRQLESVDLYD